MTLKEKINGNAKWLRYGSLMLAIIVFVLAQGVSNGTKSEKISHLEATDIEMKAELHEIELYHIEQSERMAKLEANSENIKEDVSEIKETNKEMLNLLYEIKNGN